VTPRLCLAQNPDADALLSKDPLALLVGMLLDQQVPMEWAFASPQQLVERLGRDLDASELADHDPDKLAELFATPPALHRYPAAMAGRVQALGRHLVETYNGHAAQVWSGAATGDELRRRLEGLPGFGPAKAQIFLALLGKQLRVRPPGWREAAGSYGADGVYRSVADVTDADSLSRVRAYKQQMKAAKRTAT